MTLMPMQQPRLLRRLGAWVDWWQLPAAARAETRRDRLGLPTEDPGAERVLPVLFDWLCAAQDRSASRDGGVARDYSLVKGWATSYPETTGYIVPTMLEMGRRTGREDLLQRGRRMADWLVSIQLPDGGFQGGKIDARPIVPVTFNTGQILLGLAAAEATFGGYREPMRRAADWLVRTQDPDGCWRRFPTPFAAPGEKEYETHVAWGLFEASRIDGDRGYAEAGFANLRWALSAQQDNGWSPKCCLDDPSRPLTHTIGYLLRGVLEGHRLGADRALLSAARRTADGVMAQLGPDGRLAGAFRSDWSPGTDSVCLTGSAQIATCWLMLHRITGEARYLDAGLRANAYVRRTVALDGPAETRGGVKGSFPVDGEYGTFEYLNWAAKFLADSLMLELDIRRGAGA